MARIAQSKTQLGQRLIDVRGDEKRVDYCKRLGLSPHTYRDYETGKSLPNADVLKAIAKAHDLSLNWLILGEGPMRLDEQETARPTSMDKEFFARVLEVVGRTYKEVGARITERDLARLSMDKYEEYIAMAEDPQDDEERQALMSLLHKRLKKQLTTAPAEDTSSKRQA
ncbi:helix-turn-helix transcriptional regulator [Pseudovibrio exalbescens]|nr:helix-turn-helix transcriptional regulator [Pseudovibrio exalbescens]MDD7908527.1 helix-turn-helix transcriptional regulator [Pseudovibrio exalbescens]